MTTHHYRDSPTSSQSSSSSSQSFSQKHPMAQPDDYGIGYVWAAQYQQKRDLDAGGYCKDQWTASSQTWDEPQPHSYPYGIQYAPELIYPRDLPLHAPTPISRHPSILFTDFESSSYPMPSPTPSQSFSSGDRSIIPLAADVREPRPMSSAAPPQLDTFMNTFSVRAPVLTTFPTPCELLGELNGGGSYTGGISPGSTSDSSPVEASSEPNFPSPSSSRQRDRDTRLAGFPAPETENITSHEKKRQYLECLEQYIIYLHEQIGKIGAQAIPIERVSTYRGLSSRSIRTLLVHMETSTAKLNTKTQDEEQRFLKLRDAYLDQQEGYPSDPYVAASVETGEYYSKSAHLHNFAGSSSGGPSNYHAAP